MERPKVAMSSKHLYYSQQGEDCLLWRFFEHKATGFFIDVGALDGVYLSNTKSFEEQGWEGICIEALPDMAEICRTHRPRSVCVHAACIGDGRDFVRFRRDPGGIFSGVQPDETTVAAIYESKGVEFPEFETIMAPACRLDIILASIDRSIDFVSIDVEGAELDVLAGFDVDRYRPRVILLEANTPYEKRQLDNFLNPFGYVAARSLAFNHFYVHDRNDARKLREIGFRARLEDCTNPHGRKFNPVGDMERIVWWPPETWGPRRLAYRLRRSVGLRMRHLMGSAGSG